MMTGSSVVLVNTEGHKGYKESQTRRGESYGKDNIGEARVVFGIIQKFIDSGIRQKQIGIITPYRLQVRPAGATFAFL